MKRAFLFVFISISLLYVVREIEYAGLRKNEKGEFAKLRIAFVEKNNFDILVIGSSRAECGFYTPLLDSATGMHSYNIGMTGATMPFIRSTLEAYLENSKAPKYVILNLDLHSFTDNPDTIYNFPRYFAYLDNKKLYEGLKARDKRFLFFRYLPFYSMPFYTSRYLNSSVRGFIGREGKYDKDYESGFAPYVKVAAYGNLDTLNVPVFDKDPPEYVWTELNRIMDICDSTGSKLILVTEPLFHRWEDKVLNYPRLLIQFHQYADKNKLVFIDLSHDDIRFDQELYSDPAHLDKAGAIRFTRHFSLQLMQYIRH
jgi:hypothetical protein